MRYILNRLRYISLDCVVGVYRVYHELRIVSEELYANSIREARGEPHCTVGEKRDEKGRYDGADGRKREGRKG